MESETISKVILTVMAILVIIFGVYPLLELSYNYFYKSYIEDNFCNEVHGYSGEFGFDSGYQTSNTYGIEDGYIECCKPKYIDHKETSADCMIYEYD